MNDQPSIDPRSLEKFFDVDNWAEVDNPDDPTLGPCLVWTKATNDDGYGRITVRLTDGTRKHLYTHRLRFALVVGPIPEGLELGHACPNRHCACEYHVTPMTHRQNMQTVSRPSRRLG